MLVPEAPFEISLRRGIPIWGLLGGSLAPSRLSPPPQLPHWLLLLSAGGPQPVAFPP